MKNQKTTDDANLDADSPWKTRFKHIHQILIDRITLLEYEPGMRLDLDSLATEFKVSRTPIRNVLQRLEYEGLVETRHGVGTQVTKIDFERLRETIVFRSHLAELIGDFISNQPTEKAEHIKHLESLLANIKDIKAAPSIKQFSTIDLELNSILADLIQNKMFAKTYSELYYRSARMWFYFLPQLEWKREISTFEDTIWQVKNALQTNDNRAVGFILRNAISNALFRIDKLIDTPKD
ncbi:MAG: GntR family transcriptional regulator [Hyphomicrobiales bacterium]